MRIAVIGGGIAGLATAALLAREGHELVLLEKNDAVGGRVGLWERDGFRFDTGPSWYLMPEVFDHFFRLLGTSATEQLDLVPLDPGYRVYAEGYADPLDLHADAEENVAVFEREEPGAGARLRAYLARSAELYAIAKEHFLYTTFVRLGPVFGGGVLGKSTRLSRLLLEPLGALTRRTVRDRRLRQILGYPAVFLGAAPDTTPSLYSLMSYLDLADGVRYPLGGFRTIIDRIAGLAEAEGVEVRTGAEVVRIRVDGGRATGVDLADGARLDVDAVVSAADLHHTETRLLDAAHRTHPDRAWRRRNPGPSALLILLGVRGELPELQHHTLFFSRDWDANFAAIFDDPTRIPDTPSLYVCKPSGVDPTVAPEGAENLFVLVPLPADPCLGRGGVDGEGAALLEALGDRVIAQIGSWAGIDDLAERVVVRRTIGPADFESEFHAWRGGALGLAHTLRQSAFFRPGDASRTVANLFYAGSSTIPGVGLPMCLISAELVVKRLRGDTSAGPLPEPLR
ncbi:phytoene desaturase family protein [Pseudolysinimonas kribbensis]|uniref:phytoene desaturase family protein n=1 Tax=Pseudolysinimonas kribbensis TaxID=433641 RepID=UPI0031D486C7